MAKLGVERPATRGHAEPRATESVAQPGRVETSFAETERRTGGAPTPETSRNGYRWVFACATASSDSPDEERTP